MVVVNMAVEKTEVKVIIVLVDVTPCVDVVVEMLTVDHLQWWIVSPVRFVEVQSGGESRTD